MPGERNTVTIMFTNITTKYGNPITTFTYEGRNFRWEVFTNPDDTKATYYNDGETTIFLPFAIYWDTNQTNQQNAINFMKKHGQKYNK